MTRTKIVEDAEMRRVFAVIVLCLGLICGCDAVREGKPVGEGVRVTELRCEYLQNPLGIDVVQPRLSWVISSFERGQKQTAYQVLVAGSEEELAKGKAGLWNSGKVKSGESRHVEYGGKKLDSKMSCWWKVRVWDKDGVASDWSRPAMWSMGLLADADWAGAKWIGGDWTGEPAPALPWLCKEVAITGKPRRATAYVCALGYYELYINGRKVDDQVLSPAVSDFSKRAYYITHDVTDYLVDGKNCIGLWLGRGWYVKGHPGVVHTGPLVRTTIDVEDASGNLVAIVTDESWKAKQSPIKPIGRGTAFGDYGGEQYDARLESADWNKTGVDRAGWGQAKAFTPQHKMLSAQMVQPNRIIQTIVPVGAVEVNDGVYEVDMGKNYGGWFEITFDGKYDRGDEIKMEYGDQHGRDGGLRTFNQRDIYIARGEGTEDFRTRHNYHAFRWVRITGLKAKPSLEKIKGYLIRTDYGSPSSFECSNELLNRIYNTTVWTYQCLTLGGYVVDCPTRERLGYGGDAGTSLETAMFNFDMAALYTKWLGNWRDAQIKSGDLPYTAPAYQDQGGGGPMWSGFVVALPWQLYLHYGDKRILEVSYPTIQNWLGFLDTKTRDGILEPYISYGIKMPEWNFLGDWVPPDGNGYSRVKGRVDEPSTKFFNNCYYVYNLQLASKIAGVLGKSADASVYEKKAEALQKALHEKFFNASDVTYANGEQPYLALAILMGVAPDDMQGRVMQNLENDILVRREGHLNSGMHGTYFLLKLLMNKYRNDLVFEMANKKTYPGWGYMLENGATTIWEGWRGGSHIHDTLISIGSWFIQGAGGIRIDESKPGFEHVIIRPGIVGDLKWARTQYQSMAGAIATDWKVDGDTVRLDVTIPANSTATVYVPTSYYGSVTESGRPAAEADGVKFVRTEYGSAVYEIGSGRYSFAGKFRR